MACESLVFAGGAAIPASYITAVALQLLGPPVPQLPGGFADRVGLFTAFAKPADIVMVGDSLTDLAEWGEMLPGFRVVNRGIAGDSFLGMLQRVDNVLAAQARHIFVLAGINDINAARPLAEIIADYRRLADGLASGGARLTIQSTLPVAPSYSGMLSYQEVNRRVALLNEAMREHARLHGYHFLDLVALLADTGVLRSRYTIDGLHLTAEAYLLWLDAIKADLK